MTTIPGFAAETSLYRSPSNYRGVALPVGQVAVSPAIPPCRNCDYICDLCVDKGRACGACRLCSIGACDPCPPGGCEPPERPDPWGF
jgi:hypothetical protein